MRTTYLRLLFAFCVCSSIGCQTQELLSHRMFDSFRPNPHDYRDAGDDPGSEWDFVGTEGRAEQESEFEADDQWFKKYLMSPRARSIERNLGFE
ncbi:MAG: hypothetical protein AB8G99_01550 [Planctomycetaceae bacterium]